MFCFVLFFWLLPTTNRHNFSSDFLINIINERNNCSLLFPDWFGNLTLLLPCCSLSRGLLYDSVSIKFLQTSREGTELSAWRMFLSSSLPFKMVSDIKCRHLVCYIRSSAWQTDICSILLASIYCLFRTYHCFYLIYLLIHCHYFHITCV